MLRFLFWSFVLINAALAAFNLGYLGSLDTTQPQRIKQQKNPQKLDIVSAQIALAKPELVKAPEPIACLELGNFTTTDAKTVEERLAQLALGDRQTRLNISAATSYMVYIPSMGSKEGADRKSGELQRLGIKDFFIIQDQSNLRWGVSLGVFKTEEAARQHLANLNDKGVHTGRVGPRGAGQRFAYQLHLLTGDEKTKLDAMDPSLPQHETRECQVAKR